MKKYMVTLILSAVIVLAGVATPATGVGGRLPQPVAAAEDPETLSITKFESRGASAGFGATDASGCLQRSAVLLANLPVPQVLPEPERVKTLEVLLRRVDVCAGALLLSAEGVVLNPVLSVDRDLHTASVSAERIVLADAVSGSTVTAGPIEVTWTAEGGLTAEEGTSVISPPDLPFVIVAIGTHRFRRGQATGTVFFEGVNFAGGVSEFAEIIESGTMKIEIQAAP